MSLYNFSNHFLIATPALQDFHFKKSIIYICDHTKDGAMGLIINKRSQTSYGDIMEQLNVATIEKQHYKKIALAGGPVDIDHGFVLHNSQKEQWPGTINTGDNIKLTSSKEILTDIANNDFEDDFFIGLGYSGWTAGQLEEEIKANSWLTCPADEAILFLNDTEDKFDLTCKKMGINWANISSVAGHA